MGRIFFVFCALSYWCNLCGVMRLSEDSNFSKGSHMVSCMFLKNHFIDVVAFSWNVERR